MLPLAAAGFHIVAPDQRGYGRTTGWDSGYDGDLASFRALNAVRDAFGLVSALGYRDLALVAGHDFGAAVAAWCALVRPDVFHSVALMSAPFAGPPPLPFDAANNPPQQIDSALSIHQELARLDRPRKHYQRYYSTRQANAEMRDCPQGVHAFLRGYFHYKSADWTDNKPFPLRSWTADELAKMPTYYIMELKKNGLKPWLPKCRQLPKSPPAGGCRKTSLRCTAPSTSGLGFRVDCNGTGAGRRADTTANCSCSPAGPLTCPRCSLPEKPIGGLSNVPAISSGCKRAHARGCRVAI